MLYHLALITRCCQNNPFGRKFDENRGRGNNGFGGKEVFVRQCLPLHFGFQFIGVAEWCHVHVLVLSRDKV